MLILSRKKNQATVIDNRIEVVVLAIKGNSVTLGFKGDKSVPVRRAELKREAA